MSQPKKSFSYFKKPAWKEEQARNRDLSSSSLIDSPSLTSKTDATDLFTRSGDTHAQILADKERKEQKKKEKEATKAIKKEKREKDRMEAVTMSIKAMVDDADDMPQPRAKRQRMSSDSLEHTGLAMQHSSPITSPEVEVAPQIAPRRLRPPESEIIDLENWYPETTATNEEDQDVPETAEDDVDDYLATIDPDIAELVRQEVKRKAEGVNENEEDPIVQIYITTKLPDTKPILVKRKYSQTFKQVKSAWCEHNNLDAQRRAEVYFTWKGDQVYDFTRFELLGIKLDATGTPVLATNNGYPERHDRLHLEATTKALELEEKKAKEEAAAAAQRGPPPEKKFRIIMRSKDQPDHKLQVKESTEIKKMINNYRTQFKLSKTADINLLFEGDVLSPDDQVKDTDLADVESDSPLLVDVSIK